MSAPESSVGERKQPPLGPLGTWRFSPRAAGGGGWASLTWAGEEAGTQVPRLFSCEGTVAWDFALGAGGSACISIRASLIFISLSSQFASLAFSFAVSSSLPPRPDFLPAGSVEGRAPLPGSQRRRVERGGVGERFCWGGWCRSSARRGSNGAGGRASRAGRGGEWRPRWLGKWVASKGFLSRRVPLPPPHFLSSDWGVVLSFPKGVGEAAT